jgi:hypothetical protein
MSYELWAMGQAMDRTTFVSPLGPVAAHSP